jgi:hypothetical protein
MDRLDRRGSGHHDNRCRIRGLKQWHGGLYGLDGHYDIKVKVPPPAGVSPAARMAALPGYKP